jgi:hypothetical protein
LIPHRPLSDHATSPKASLGPTLSIARLPTNGASSTSPSARAQERLMTVAG